MSGAFDDLIPAQGAAAPAASAPSPATGAFDDLIPKQWQGWTRYPAMAGSYLAKGASEALGMLGAGSEWLNQGGEGALNGGALYPRPDPTRDTRLATQAGIVNRPDLHPQNTGERYLAVGSEGVGAGLPQMMMGDAGWPAVLRNVAENVASAVGGEKAAETFPSHPDLARLAGGFAGAAGAGGALGLANRIAGAATGAESPVMAAYRRLGIKPALAGDVTGSPTAQMVQAFAAKTPGGAGRIHAASENAVHAWGNALEDTASKLGSSRTQQEAGTALQDQSRQWLADWEARKEAAENALDGVMHPQAPVNISGVQHVLSGANRIAGGPALSSVMTDPEFTKLGIAAAFDKAPYRARIDAALKALPAAHNVTTPDGAVLLNVRTPKVGWLPGEDVAGPALPPDLPAAADKLGINARSMPLFNEAANDPAAWDRLYSIYSNRDLMPWETVRGWRSKVGQQIEQSLLARDGKAAGWRQIYGALSDALGNAAETQGAAPEWQAANQVSREGHQFVENTLGDFINHRNPAQNTITPEAAATAALSGMRAGGSGLAAIRAQMPGAADELAAYKLRSLGLANPGQQSASLDRLSPGTFLTNTAKLSPEARDSLFGDNPEVAQSVADLGTVGGSMKSTERFVNHSNTGAHAATGLALGHALSLPAILEGYEKGGLPGALAGWGATAALPWTSGFAAARATSTPWLTSLMANPGAVSLPSGGLLGSPALQAAARGLLPGFGP